MRGGWSAGHGHRCPVPVEKSPADRWHVESVPHVGVRVTSASGPRPRCPAVGARRYRVRLTMSALFELPRPRRSSRAPPGARRCWRGSTPGSGRRSRTAGSPLLIVAGAGSGKTRVLTHRIAWLLAERGVHPGEIMSITFTNKAAAEMKERVDALVGRRANAMWVSTFHSMCVRILRREAKHLGVRSRVLRLRRRRHPPAGRPGRPRPGPRPEEVRRPPARRADLQPEERAARRGRRGSAGHQRLRAHGWPRSTPSTRPGCARPTRSTSTT